MNVFIDHIEHPVPGRGYAEQEARLRQADEAACAFEIQPGKRVEFRVAPGKCAVVHVIEGMVRFEGDDSPAAGGDTVWFKPAPADEEALLGVQADAPSRGFLYSVVKPAGTRTS